MIHLPIDPTWTLFLDRDGVINQWRQGTYITRWSEFQFIPGSIEAIVNLNRRFGRTILVTNQQGVGKQLMTREALDEIHQNMQAELQRFGGKLDAIYACTDMATKKNNGRKPNPDMAFAAKKDFPDIDFTKSVIVGDSISDMEFGSRLGMKTILIEGKTEEAKAAQNLAVTARFGRLWEFWNWVG